MNSQMPSEATMAYLGAKRRTMTPVSWRAEQARVYIYIYIYIYIYTHTHTHTLQHHTMPCRGPYHHHGMPRYAYVARCATGRRAPSCDSGTRAPGAHPRRPCRRRRATSTGLTHPEKRVPCTLSLRTAPGLSSGVRLRARAHDTAPSRRSPTEQPLRFRHFTKGVREAMDTEFGDLQLERAVSVKPAKQWKLASEVVPEGSPEKKLRLLRHPGLETLKRFRSGEGPGSRSRAGRP